MTATVVQHAMASSSGASSLVVTLGAAPTNGNYLKAIVSCYTGRTITPPTGWMITGDTDGAGTIRSFQLKAGASEPTSYTWGLNTSDAWAVVIYEVTGSAAGFSSPDVGIHNNNNFDGTVSGNVRSIAQGADELLIVAFSLNQSGTTQTSATPSGFTADRTALLTWHSLVTGHIAPTGTARSLTVGVTWGIGGGTDGSCLLSGASTTTATSGKSPSIPVASAPSSLTGWVYKGRSQSSLDAGSVA